MGTAVAFGLAGQLLWGVTSLPVLIGCGFLAGLTIAPVLVSGTSLVESRVGPGVLTESLAWTITGLTVGVTAGSAIAGAAVDAWGAERAFAVPAVAAAVAGLLVAARCAAAAGTGCRRRPRWPTSGLTQARRGRSRTGRSRAIRQRAADAAPPDHRKEPSWLLLCPPSP